MRIARNRTLSDSRRERAKTELCPIFRPWSVWSEGAEILDEAGRGLTLAAPLAQLQVALAAADPRNMASHGE